MKKLQAGFLGLALAGVIPPAAAELGEIPVNPALRDQFYFAIGAFFAKTTTEAQLDSTRLGVGANVTFENTLGMDASKEVPSAIGRIRLGERWRVEAEWFQLNRSGARRLDRDIQWGDTVFPVNTQLSSTFDFYDLRLSAGYSFFKRADKEIGVGLGLHVASYNVNLSGNAVGTEQEDVLAPLPVISFYGQFALTERWAVGGRLDRFSLSYSKYDGSLTSLGLDLSYQPFRHVGFGVAYRALFIHMQATDASKTLKFTQTFEGPLVFMNASF
jgi:hypothetical protein